MPHCLGPVIAGPWVLAVVVVTGPGAVLPSMPEVPACGVAAAGTGRPHLGRPVVAAASGACAGDQISFRIGRRGTETVGARFTHRRTRAVPARVHRLPPGRGALLIVVARYLPGGRSTKIFASRPLPGLPPASGSAPAFSGPAVLLQHRLPSPAGRHQRQAAAPEPGRVKPI